MNQLQDMSNHALLGFLVDTVKRREYFTISCVVSEAQELYETESKIINEILFRLEETNKRKAWEEL